MNEYPSRAATTSVERLRVSPSLVHLLSEDLGVPPRTTPPEQCPPTSGGDPSPAKWCTFSWRIFDSPQLPLLPSNNHRHGKVARLPEAKIAAAKGLWTHLKDYTPRAATTTTERLAAS